MLRPGEQLFRSLSDPANLAGVIVDDDGEPTETVRSAGEDWIKFRLYRADGPKLHVTGSNTEPLDWFAGTHELCDASAFTMLCYPSARK